MKAVLAAGANPREVDQDGMNPLHWMALSEHVDIARVLIAAGTPLNQTGKHGFTPLLYAATVAAGADKKVRAKDGKTALSQATRFRYPEIREALAK